VITADSVVGEAHPDSDDLDVGGAALVGMSPETEGSCSDAAGFDAGFPAGDAAGDAAGDDAGAGPGKRIWPTRL